MDQKWAAGYLSAMIDGEGCVSFGTLPSGALRRSVRIANTEQSIVDACFEACKVLDIPVSVHGGKNQRPHEKPVWTIYIGGPALAKLASVVDLKIEEKKKKLLQGATANAQLKRSKDQRPMEEIAHLHEEEGMTYDEIAEHFSISRTALYRWLREAKG